MSSAAECVSLPTTSTCFSAPACTIDDAVATTELLARSVAEPAIPRGLVDGDPGALDRFDRRRIGAEAHKYRALGPDPHRRVRPERRRVVHRVVAEPADRLFAFHAFNCFGEGFGFDPDDIWITVFEGDEKLGIGPDEEAIEAWLSVGVPRERIVPLGAGQRLHVAGDVDPVGADVVDLAEPDHIPHLAQHHALGLAEDGAPVEDRLGAEVEPRAVGEDDAEPVDDPGRIGAGHPERHRHIGAADRHERVRRRGVEQSRRRDREIGQPAQPAGRHPGADELEPGAAVEHGQPAALGRREGPQASTWPNLT